MVAIPITTYYTVKVAVYGGLQARRMFYTRFPQLEGEKRNGHAA
jgi:hypothetical protein